MINIKQFLRRSKVPLPIWLILGASFSLFLSWSASQFLFTKVLRHIVDENRNFDSFMSFIAVILWLLSLVFPITLVLLCLTVAFRSEPKRKQLANVLCSYFVLIIVFAGLYYSFSFIADYNDAMERYDFVNNHKNDLLEGNGEAIYLARSSSRAFSGIRERLWTGVDYALYSNHYTDDVNIWAKQSEIPMRDLIFFRPDARLSVFGDCLHFSVISMATVGFGDIAPTKWYSKLACDIQVILGQILFVVALGMLFSGWSGDTKGRVSSSQV
jgi:Ion channel.